MPLRINFLLPGPPHVPNGGSKVVYRYANHLAQRGHRVRVYHQKAYWNISDPLRSIKWGSIALWENLRIHSILKWMPLDSQVELRVIPQATANRMKPADVTIATAWDTAESVTALPDSIRGKGHYLIQHLEDWDQPREIILETWKLPLKKIVISRWLQSLAASIGEEAHFIPNGLDFQEFGIDIPPETRRPESVGMLWHSQPWKGSASGLQALEIVQRQVPRLHVELFGTDPSPFPLPPWITYHCRPSRTALRAMYNRCALFLAPSLSEGWGLPPSEAMQCGSAVVATDIGGHREFCHPNSTALLAPAGQPDALAHQILTLIGDSRLRLEIAETGHRLIQNFSWEKAVSSLEELILPSAK